jgi:hypothetical protein
MLPWSIFERLLIKAGGIPGLRSWAAAAREIRYDAHQGACAP